MPASRIYLDYAATSPLDPRVVEAMAPFLSEAFGNPSSLHDEGRRAREAVEGARTQVAALLGSEAKEIVFTASGTEADNMAIAGVIAAVEGKAVHVVTSAIEHPAVLEPCRNFRRRGVGLTLLPVGADGLVDPQDLRRSLRPETRLVSIMVANNVVGTLQPIHELASITHEHGAVFHTDAVQAAGHVPIDVRRDGIDLLSLSAHKLCGPKGVGALFIREGVALEPLIHGGGQEGGRRSATENTAGIVGFGRAAQLAAEARGAETVRLVRLRERLLHALMQGIPGAYLIGHPYRRLPGHLCLGFAGLENDTIHLMLELDAAGVAVSTGSACSAHRATEPSYVLTAMGFDPLRARGALRITLGRFTTPEQIDRVLEILPRAVRILRPVTTRAMSPQGAGA